MTFGIPSLLLLTPFRKIPPLRAATIAVLVLLSGCITEELIVGGGLENLTEVIVKGPFSPGMGAPSEESLRKLDIEGPISVPKGVSSQYLAYDGERVKLDVYNPGKPDSPVVILMHGSAGIEGDRGVRYREFATGLMNRGIIAINVHYFDTSQDKWLTTFIKTITYARMISDADEDRVGLMGYSGGGISSLLVAARDERVALVAVNSCRLPQGFTEADAKNLPPILMIAGTADTEPYKALMRIRDIRQKAGLPFESRIEEGIGHDNISLDIFNSEWKTIEDFFDRNFRIMG